jgi:hypothetical protein
MQDLTNQCGVGRGAANGLPDRTGRHPETARGNIVTWVYRAAGHVVDTRARKEKPRLLTGAELGREKWPRGWPPASAPVASRAWGQTRGR